LQIITCVSILKYYGRAMVSGRYWSILIKMQQCTAGAQLLSFLVLHGLLDRKQAALAPLPTTASNFRLHAGNKHVNLAWNKANVRRVASELDSCYRCSQSQFEIQVQAWLSFSLWLWFQASKFLWLSVLYDWMGYAFTLKKYVGLYNIVVNLEVTLILFKIGIII